MTYTNGARTNSIEITKADLGRLNPEVYLNDSLMNFYLKFIHNYILP